MRATKYFLLIIWLSCMWMFKVNLGDWVWHLGKKYVVINGVRSQSWRLAGLENGDSGWVPRAECQKEWTLGNVIGSFRSGYRFYMGAWYGIWKAQGIKGWMKQLPIWGDAESEDHI